MPTLGDPLKLVPFIGYGAVLTMLYLGKVNTNDAIALLGAMGLAHAGISAINNSNPKQ